MSGWLIEVFGVDSSIVHYGQIGLCAICTLFLPRNKMWQDSIFVHPIGLPSSSKYFVDMESNCEGTNIARIGPHDSWIALGANVYFFPWKICPFHVISSHWQIFRSKTQCWLQPRSCQDRRRHLKAPKLGQCCCQISEFTVFSCNSVFADRDYRGLYFAAWIDLLFN